MAALAADLQQLQSRFVKLDEVEFDLTAALIVVGRLIAWQQFAVEQSKWAAIEFAKYSVAKCA